jgi:hypothetical protein
VKRKLLIFYCALSLLLCTAAFALWVWKSFDPSFTQFNIRRALWLRFSASNVVFLVRNGSGLRSVFVLPVMLLAWLSLIPLFFLAHRWLNLRRLREVESDCRLCPACGYDMRATPERCPECGRVTA